MKYLSLLIVMMSSIALADTVITYDDGSTYTPLEGEKIYVSPSDLWQKSTLNSGKLVQLKKQVPNPKRDYVTPDPTPADDEQVGSHEWCKAYVPWSEGYTFNMQAWLRYCDTDNNNSYGCGDDTFDESDEAGVCPAS